MQVIRRIAASQDGAVTAKTLRTTEFLVTNGLGGYASGTISGVTTRRFHGLLVSALPSPHGRTMMLNLLREEIGFADGTSLVLDEHHPRDSNVGEKGAKLAEFSLDRGMPVWRYEAGGAVIEK